MDISLKYINLIQRIIVESMIRLKGFLIIPFYFILLGPAEYGLWIQVLSTTAIIIPFSILKLETSILRFVPGLYKFHQYKSVFLLYLFSTTFSLGIYGLLYFIQKPMSLLIFGSISYQNLMVPAFTYLIIKSQLKIFQSIFRSLNLISTFSMIQIIILILELPFAYLFFKIFSANVYYFIISLNLINFFGIIIYILFLLNKKMIDPHPPYDKKIFQYLKYSLPLLPSEVFLALLTFIDRFIIINMIDIETVGIYSVVIGLTSIVSFGLVPTLFVYMPLINKSWDDKKFAETLDHFKNSILLFFFFSIPLLAVLTSLGSHAFFLITNLIISPIWFFLVSLSFIANSITIIGTMKFSLEKRTILVSMVFAIMVVSLSIFAYFLVPLFGIYGMFLALLFGQLVGMIPSVRNLVSLKIDFSTAKVGKIVINTLLISPLLYLGSSLPIFLLFLTLLLSGLIYLFLSIKSDVLPKSQFQKLINETRFSNKFLKILF